MISKSSKLPWWHLTVFVLKDQDTLMMSLCQFTLLELMYDYNLQITVTWWSHIRAQLVSVSTASAHLQHLCGTTFRLNWRTATLADRVFNLASSHGFLSVPTRNRRPCELLFKRRYVNLHFDWLIDFACKLLWGMWLDKPHGKNIDRSRAPQAHKVGAYAMSWPFFVQNCEFHSFVHNAKFREFVYFSSQTNLFST